MASHDPWTCGSRAKTFRRLRWLAQRVAGDIAEVTNVAADSGVAAERARQSAGELAREAEELSTELSAFLARVRAA